MTLVPTKARHGMVLAQHHAIMRMENGEKYVLLPVQESGAVAC